MSACLHQRVQAMHGQHKLSTCAQLQKSAARRQPIVARRRQQVAPAPQAADAPPALVPPPVAYETAAMVGASKAALSVKKIFILGILAGVYIGFGALLALTCGGTCPGLAENNPGLKQMVMGLFGLPTGLLMVMVAGAELFTGNTAVVTAAVAEGKASMANLVKSWTVSWLGNLAGSVGLALLTVHAGLLTSTGTIAKVAATKTSMAFLPVFCRGIMCNWLVCLAVWMASAASTLPGKFLAILPPISMFIALSLEHSVANMFIVPAGIMAGGDVTWAACFMKNLLPVTLGNTVGGALFVALAYASVFSKGKSS